MQAASKLCEETLHLRIITKETITFHLAVAQQHRKDVSLLDNDPNLHPAVLPCLPTLLHPTFVLTRGRCASWTRTVIRTASLRPSTAPRPTASSTSWAQAPYRAGTGTTLSLHTTLDGATCHAHRRDIGPPRVRYLYMIWILGLGFFIRCPLRSPHISPHLPTSPHISPHMIWTLGLGFFCSGLASIPTIYYNYIGDRLYGSGINVTTGYDVLTSVSNCRPWDRDIVYPIVDCIVILILAVTFVFCFWLTESIEQAVDEGQATAEVLPPHAGLADGCCAHSSALGRWLPCSLALADGCCAFVWTWPMAPPCSLVVCSAPPPCPLQDYTIFIPNPPKTLGAIDAEGAAAVYCDFFEKLCARPPIGSTSRMRSFATKTATRLKQIGSPRKAFSALDRGASIIPPDDFSVSEVVVVKNSMRMAALQPLTAHGGSNP